MSDETHEQVRQLLGEKYECYVLVTCDKPSDEGKMQVEMDYSGDPVLAAYLLQGAQTYLDEQDDETHFFEEEILNN